MAEEKDALVPAPPKSLSLVRQAAATSIEPVLSAFRLGLSGVVGWLGGLTGATIVFLAATVLSSPQQQLLLTSIGTLTGFVLGVIGAHRRVLRPMDDRLHAAQRELQDRIRTGKKDRTPGELSLAPGETSGGELAIHAEESGLSLANDARAPGANPR